MISVRNKALQCFAFGGLLLAAAAALSGCATGGGYGYDEYGLAGGYPYYYGDVYVDGSWYGGPLRYRDFDGRRQYWVHNHWNDGQTRGDYDHGHDFDHGGGFHPR
jgi:hypothetical protein